MTIHRKTFRTDELEGVEGPELPPVPNDCDPTGLHVVLKSGGPAMLCVSIDVQTGRWICRLRDDRLDSFDPRCLTLSLNHASMNAH